MPSRFEQRPSFEPATELAILTPFPDCASVYESSAHPGVVFRAESADPETIDQFNGILGGLRDVEGIDNAGIWPVTREEIGNFAIQADDMPGVTEDYITAVSHRLSGDSIGELLEQDTESDPVASALIPGVYIAGARYLRRVTYSGVASLYVSEAFKPRNIVLEPEEDSGSTPVPVIRDTEVEIFDRAGALNGEDAGAQDRLIKDTRDYVDMVRGLSGVMDSAQREVVGTFIIEMLSEIQLSDAKADWPPQVRDRYFRELTEAVNGLAE